MRRFRRHPRTASRRELVLARAGRRFASVGLTIRRMRQSGGFIIAPITGHHLLMPARFPPTHSDPPAPRSALHGTEDRRTRLISSRYMPIMVRDCRMRPMKRPSLPGSSHSRPARSNVRWFSTSHGPMFQTWRAMKSGCLMEVITSSWMLLEQMSPLIKSPAHGSLRAQPMLLLFCHI